MACPSTGTKELVLEGVLSVSGADSSKNLPAVLYGLCSGAHIFIAEAHVTPSSGANRFTKLEGEVEAGLMSAPPMEHSLAAYLVPTQNSGITGPLTLPTDPCRFLFKQLGRIFSEQACACRSQSSMSLLQTHQAICLGELSEVV